MSVLFASKEGDSHGKFVTWKLNFSTPEQLTL